MNGIKPQLEYTFAGPIQDRIGPILDTAFLKLIPNETLKEITLIRAKALQTRIRADQVEVDEVVRTIEKAKLIENVRT